MASLTAKPNRLVADPTRKWLRVLCWTVIIMLLSAVVGSSSRTAFAADPEWLSVTNFYRATAHLPGVTEDPALSSAAFLHARYIVESGDFSHDEDPSSPWYTPEGDAGNTNIMVSTQCGRPDRQIIETWMTGPFHGLAIIEPTIQTIGYSRYCKPGAPGFDEAFVLNTTNSVRQSSASVTYPVVWPGQGATVPLSSVSPNETPDPATGCPGYENPGLPLLVQLGSAPSVTDYSLTRDGIAVSVCEVDPNNYLNPDPGHQALGRAILAQYNAVLLIPKDPLQPGNYSASLTSGGSRLAWAFSVTSPDPTRLPTPPPLATPLVVVTPTSTSTPSATPSPSPTRTASSTNDDAARRRARRRALRRLCRRLTRRQERRLNLRCGRLRR